MLARRFEKRKCYFLSLIGLITSVLEISTVEYIATLFGLYLADFIWKSVWLIAS